MKKIVVGATLLAMSASVLAFSGAEVLLGGVIGYIAGKDEERHHQEHRYGYPQTQYVVPVPQYNYPYSVQPSYPEIYQQPMPPRYVIMYDQNCRCYRKFWTLP